MPTFVRNVRFLQKSVLKNHSDIEKNFPLSERVSLENGDITIFKGQNCCVLEMTKCWQQIFPKQRVRNMKILTWIHLNSNSNCPATSNFSTSLVHELGTHGQLRQFVKKVLTNLEMIVHTDGPYDSIASVAPSTAGCRRRSFSLKISRRRWSQVVHRLAGFMALFNYFLPSALVAIRPNFAAMLGM